MANRSIAEVALTAEQLRAALTYDLKTGLFRWKHRADVARQVNTRRAGKVAGCNDGQYGYTTIRLKNCCFQAHRLAWLYMTGEWPADMVDHIDRNPANNAWSNLRAANKSQNMMNQAKPPKNTSGYKGVVREIRTGRWIAQIEANGKNYYLGTFNSPKEAYAARCEAANRLHGEFARHD